MRVRIQRIAKFILLNALTHCSEPTTLLVLPEDILEDPLFMTVYEAVKSKGFTLIFQSPKSILASKLYLDPRVRCWFWLNFSCSFLRNKQLFMVTALVYFFSFIYFNAVWILGLVKYITYYALPLCITLSNTHYLIMYGSMFWLFIVMPVTFKIVARLESCLSSI